jgi:Na+/H+-dicarboxylate symporter
MVLPADRPLDMAQTGLNVAGDMLPAVHMDRKLIRERHKAPKAGSFSV